MELLGYHIAKLTYRCKKQLGMLAEDCEGLRTGDTIAAENGAEETLLWRGPTNCR